MATTEDGSTVELGMVGNEGLIGVPVFLGDSTALETAVVQIPGDAFRVRVDHFKKALVHCGILHDAVQKYVLFLFRHICQTAVCNRLHLLRKRLCSRLLMIQDRVDRAVLPITQEFLAQVLGTSRTQVNMSLKGLRDSGLVQYGRGKIEIVNRPGLKAAACECYESLKLLGDLAEIRDQPHQADARLCR